CSDVQWTGSTPELLATFTITANELASAAANGLIWTDQDVQRGIVPESLPEKPRRELSLADGYPDPRQYIFSAANADEMAEKLLLGERLYLNPLIWNLRPGRFEAYWNKHEASLYLYDGKIYLPDSHHRHQAILKAYLLWK